MGTLLVGKLRSSYLSLVVSIANFRSALTRIGGGIIEGAGDDENVSRCPMGEHIFQTTLCTTIDIAIPAEVSTIGGVWFASYGIHLEKKRLLPKKWMHAHCLFSASLPSSTKSCSFEWSK